VGVNRDETDPAPMTCWARGRVDGNWTWCRRGPDLGASVGHGYGGKPFAWVGDEQLGTLDRRTIAILEIRRGYYR